MKPKFWNKGKLYLSKKDTILKSIITKYPNEHIVLNSNYYHCLLNSIIGQQISVSAANSIKNRFFSLKKNISPVSVSKLNSKSLKKVGLSKQKTVYIKNLSIFFIKNKIFINNINNLSEDEIREKMILIKGVGNWTIDMFLIFGLGKLNVFPKKDLGLLKAISINYKKKFPISDKNLNIFYNKWKPYNTIATWYLWRSLDPLPISY
tara:strand:- start:2 stop:619 length:618 start_codon:yes stop_codon:yes gene_type:complete